MSITGWTFALAAMLVFASGPTEAKPKSRVLALVDPGITDPTTAKERLSAFARLVERRVGWKDGALQVRVVSELSELGDVHRRGLAMAILSEHSFAQAASRFSTGGGKFSGLEILGHAMDLQGGFTARWLLARKGARIDQNIEHYPGLRLALPKNSDLQWIRVLVDGIVDPATHFRLVLVKDTREGLEYVTTDVADVVFVNEYEKAELEARLHPMRGDLKVVYMAPAMPRGALATFGKALSTSERKRILAVLDDLCTKEGLVICSELGFLDLKPGLHPLHLDLAYKYKNYK